MIRENERELRDRERKRNYVIVREIEKERGTT